MRRVHLPLDPLPIVSTFLCLGLVGWRCNDPSPDYSGEVCIRRTRNGGLGMPDLESHWLAERLAYLGRSLSGDAVWRRRASRIFSHLKSDQKAEGRRLIGEAPFLCECRTALRNFSVSSDLSQPPKEWYRELVVDSDFGPSQ